MPTVLRWKGYRFHFWSGDRQERPHIHVMSGSGEAKIWLQPVQLHRVVGLADHAVNQLVRKVTEEEHVFLQAWHDYFRR